MVRTESFINTARRREVASAVIEAVAAAAKVPVAEVSLESNLEGELGLDSMTFIGINVAIEERLGCVLAAERAGDDLPVTVGDLIAQVTRAIEHPAVEVASC